MVEPDHLKRSIRALDLGLQDGVEGLAGRLHDAVEEGAGLSRADEELILRNYLDRSHTE